MITQSIRLAAVSSVLLLCAAGCRAQDSGPAPGQAVALVTGSTSGLGREVAFQLATSGTFVIVHGRNRERGGEVVEQIRSNGGSASFYRADLASIQAVDDFADTILRDFERLDLLINNAGILETGQENEARRLSADGHELLFAVNYLAGFQLTQRLVPLLRQSTPARIVNVSSIAQTRLDFANVMLKTGYTGFRAYGQSKLAQIMYGFDLAEELKDTGVTVSSLHPASMMNTNMVLSAGLQPRTTVEEGAEAVMHLATQDVESGQYYSGMNPSRANDQAYDAGARLRLRDLSLGLLGRNAWTFDDSARGRIDSTLQAFVDAGTHAGLSAVVHQAGREVYFGAFGKADQEANRAMERDAIVQVFSMTKPVTGVALMTLWESGAFDLDDPLSKYAAEFNDLRVYAGTDAEGVPTFERLEREISIRDITRHTAGFAAGAQTPGVGALFAAADPNNSENSLTEFAEKLGDVPLAFQPGSQWLYGPSVDVQAFLVERISGQSYREYVREHVLDPLGMDDTRYVVEPAERHRMAAMYRTEDDGSRSRVPDEEAFARNFEEWALTPGGWGLTSTLDDYLRLARMLLNRGELEGIRILEPETVRMMATNHLSESVVERSWLPGQGQVGFGIDFAVRLRPPATAEEKGGVVGEFFWDGAGSTLFWVDPANDLTAVLFAQLLPYDSVGLHKAFRDAVYGSTVLSY
jgi:CubicO group peptidase (beta-lactamase class C family)/NAD(P)-dependent dehydrogenase (short-subunit alcohol dehydrogenase family)